MKLKLEIEPIPQSSWGVSLANKLGEKKWNKIRKQVYKDANYECEICEEVNLTLNAHEVWAYDDRQKIQRLKEVQCVCELCHDVKHFGRSSQVYPKEYVEELIKHWCKINKKTRQDFVIYQKQIFELSKKRAKNFYLVKVGNRLLG